MLKRIITAIVGLCVFIPVCIFSHTVVFPIAIALVSVISLYEITKCMGFQKKLSLSLPLYPVAAAFPFLVKYLPDSKPWAVGLIAFMCASVYIVYLFSLIVWSHGKLNFSDAITYFAMVAYIFAALNCIVYIREYSNIGQYLYILVFMAAWITDTFAYFTGYLIGKHKLIEDVSPKKTIEGSIGGIVFCIISFIVFGLILDNMENINANLIFLAVCGLVASVVSQVGDLIMSVIKRHYGIKDYGKLFPGHGGMLDRFDSVLAVSLAIAAVCMISSIIGISMI